MPHSAFDASSPRTASQPLLPDFRIPPRRAALIAALILLVAGAWRVALAVQMPVVSRDGVVFCWYARALGERGLEYLRSPDAQQHPLFPAMLLAGQRVAAALGAPGDPLTWQIVGQSICCIAGLFVVYLVGSIAAQLVLLLELPVDERSTRLVAMSLAALLDLNLWLSVDVMSDQVHLAFYLAAVRLALPSWATWRLALAGIFAGLAFLTRQEGLMPAVAAVTSLGLAYKSLRPRRLTTGILAVAIGFVALAGPYWSVVGRFSTKKDPTQWLGEESVRAIDPGAQPAAAGLVFAKLETKDLSWFAALPEILNQLLRAGRVIVPLFALLPLINLRRQWLDPRFACVLACVCGHLAMVAILLDRYGYLATRHMLVVVSLLIPLAAMFLARLVEIAVLRRSWILGIVAAAATLGTLIPYALRIPNGHERYLRDAASWLAEQRDADATLVSGSSGRRIAFYAGLPWRHWDETPEDVEGTIGLLRAAGRGHFALETGPGYERRGNELLLGALLADRDAALAVREVRTVDGGRGATLHMLAFSGRPKEGGSAPATQDGGASGGG